MFEHEKSTSIHGSAPEILAIQEFYNERLLKIQLL